ncbi:MAG: hypothetical protein DRP56_08560 [Planctomycetota bacterium]|nr:MAG: hypothetical protein DRP56_08560 [Planctomycetota bacterium]
MKLGGSLITILFIAAENLMLAGPAFCNIQNFNLHDRIDIALFGRNASENLNSEKLIPANRLRFIGKLLHATRESKTVKDRPPPP